MTRLLLAGALAATGFLAAPAAQACELQYCTWAQPVCSRIDCSRPFVLCERVAGRTVCV